MRMKVLSAGESPEVSFPSQTVRRIAQTIGLKGFFIALLLIASFMAIVGTMLVHYPQKVDAFLNPDEPAMSRPTVNSNN